MIKFYVGTLFFISGWMSINSVWAYDEGSNFWLWLTIPVAIITLIAGICFIKDLDD